VACYYNKEHANTTLLQQVMQKQETRGYTHFKLFLLLNHGIERERLLCLGVRELFTDTAVLNFQ
jgi:hypothetical protein